MPHGIPSRPEDPAPLPSMLTSRLCGETLSIRLSASSTRRVLVRLCRTAARHRTLLQPDNADTLWARSQTTPGFSGNARAQRFATLSTWIAPQCTTLATPTFATGALPRRCAVLSALPYAALDSGRPCECRSVHGSPRIRPGVAGQTWDGGSPDVGEPAHRTTAGTLGGPGMFGRM